MPRKVDALKRLERWLKKPAPKVRFIELIAVPSLGQFTAVLHCGKQLPVIGRNIDLPAAIHAALDKAEGKPEKKVSVKP